MLENISGLEKVMNKVWKEDWVKVRSKNLALVIRYLLYNGEHVRSTSDVVSKCVDLVAESLKESKGFKEWSLKDSNLLLVSKGLRSSSLNVNDLENVFNNLVIKKGGLK